jgi:leucyl/phenylalanyl-tRNA--protein transferase
MRIYELGNEHVFPPATEAIKEGLLAIGGDLHPSRLLNAYRNGIFPWYEDGEPIMWWSPDPRLVIQPHEIYISKSLRKIIRSKTFDLKFDCNFEAVIDNCANTKRKEGDGTWLTPALKNAMTMLHHAGYAHSVEAYYQGNLVGGLYGLAIGKVFFGESMFHHMSNASKVAFVYLSLFLQKNGFILIDAQQDTAHMRSFGAYAIRRDDFIATLKQHTSIDIFTDKWDVKSIDVDF